MQLLAFFLLFRYFGLFSSGSCFVFESESHRSRVGLELPHFLGAGITDVHHHAPRLLWR